MPRIVTRLVAQLLLPCLIQGLISAAPIAGAASFRMDPTRSVHALIFSAEAVNAPLSEFHDPSINRRTAVRVGLLVAMVISAPFKGLGQSAPFRYVDTPMLIGFQGGIALVLFGVGYLAYTFLRDFSRNALWYRYSAGNPAVESKTSHYAVAVTTVLVGAGMAIQQWPSVLRLINKPPYHMPESVLRDGNPDMELVIFMAQTATMVGITQLAIGIFLVIMARRANWSSRTYAVVVGNMFALFGLLMIGSVMLAMGIVNPLDLRHFFHISLLSSAILFYSTKMPPGDNRRKQLGGAA